MFMLCYVYEYAGSFAGLTKTETLVQRKLVQELCKVGLAELNIQSGVSSSAKSWSSIMKLWDSESEKWSYALLDSFKATQNCDNLHSQSFLHYNFISLQNPTKNLKRTLLHEKSSWSMDRVNKTKKDNIIVFDKTIVKT